MAALDWIFVAVLLASMLIGAWRGLVFEVLSLLGWVVSFFVAQWFAQDVAALLPMGESADSLRYAAGFVVVFVASVFACGFVTWLAKKLVDAIGLRPADRTLGAAFGVLRGVVVLLAVAVVVGLTPMREALWWQESQGAPVLAEVLKGLKPALPDEFGRHLPS
ncbi:colicin V synthesis protein [Acidovorax sp. Root275]|uniref:CvpA family protein n=1 Tax=unclassified Acidovorax TaxID=2684926 RepID=UPI00070B7F93|nr:MULTISPECIES: CvpA family protein [unclassified Acidovorax]KRD25585.1 colicin V synthesis protein [Acidovorax sp. Root267]KRD56062.1 colicin V synthesis protein [Acidovorax sp. Root275]